MSLRVGPPASPPPGHVYHLMQTVCSLLQYSVLTGDYLLSKAIVSLARLHNVRVVSLMSMAVADFIEGKSRFLNANARHGPAPVCNTCPDQTRGHVYDKRDMLLCTPPRRTGRLPFPLPFPFPRRCG
jgi:hypothetical protein